MIDARTQVYALIGHPVRHSLSPRMHNAAFSHLGMNAVYVAFDVPPAGLAAALQGMASLGFGGANITIPHKEAAFRLAAEHDEAAVLTGAVNTVCFTGGVIKGCNTDLSGFLTAVEEAFGEGPAGKRVLLLGAGGGGRAVALGCARAGARVLKIYDVEPARAASLAAEIKQKTGLEQAEAIVSDQVEAAARDADLLVNATPVGMKPDDPPPIGPDCFRPGQMAYDLVYVRPVTAFTGAALAAGARAANGLGMLLHQGAHAFRLWTGREPPVEVMRRELEAAVYGGQAEGSW